jgi:HK97 family phage major capsid protein
MAGMTMEQLDAYFDSAFEKKMATEREKTTAEISSKGLDANAVAAAVDIRMKELTLDETKRKTVRAEMMEQFEIAAAATGGQAVTTNSKNMIGKMMVAGLKAMEVSKATNIKNVGGDVILDMAKKLFPNEKALQGIMQKELTAGVPSAGGFTIPQVLLPDYIEYLYNNTILDKLGVQKVPMPNGNFSIPRMNATSAVGWVGETAKTTETDATFGAVNLKAKKLKAMTALSNTLLRQNVVGLDSWVSRDLQRVSRIALDQAFLYGLGTEYTPRGLKNITDIQTSGTTGTAFGLTTPIDMVALLEQANVPMDNVNWILSPLGKSWIQSKAFSTGPFAWASEMASSKTINGFPFISSASVEKDGSSAYSDFWLVDASMILWGVAYDLSLEMSREGTFTSGSDTISAFDQDLTLIRIIGEHDFGVRQPKAVLYGQYSKT